MGSPTLPGRPATPPKFWGTTMTNRAARLILGMTLFLLAGNTAFAQIDIAGDWDHPGPVLMEDPVDRGNGPEVGDTLGSPLNEAGIREAESYSPSWINIPEH